MSGFTRGFRLHVTGGRVLDGAQFPSGRVLVLDDPEYGLATAATSLEELVKGYPDARAEWPDDSQALTQPVLERWHLELQQGDGWLSVTRPTGDRQAAAAALARRRERHPDRVFRMVRVATHHTTEDL
ncbi:MAG TPA: hypothetical protein VFH77_17420 [Streptomyces sp.]|nr:hypothetical protein [Streptomyces sp.]